MFGVSVQTSNNHEINRLFTQGWPDLRERSVGMSDSSEILIGRRDTRYTRQGQPKKCISAQRDMMNLKGGFFCFLKLK
jgi:hypothetical protein